LRASDADRQRIADLLSDAYADGRLNMTEFNDRTTAVWSAKTLGDLVPLTTDLGGPPVPVAPGIAGQMPVRIDDVSPIHGFAILSEHHQPANWVVPSTLSSLAFMGSDNYDFRTATFVSPRVEMSVGVLMGNVGLQIPDGVNVIDKTICIMGSVTFKGMTPPLPGAPTIELTGFVLMGSVEVRGAEYATLGQKLGFSSPGDRRDRDRRDRYRDRYR